MYYSNDIPHTETEIELPKAEFIRFIEDHKLPVFGHIINESTAIKFTIYQGFVISQGR